MPKLPKEVLIDRKQLASEIHERNVYRDLLGKCLDTFEEMPNNKVYWGSTYDLAKDIKQAFSDAIK